MLDKPIEDTYLYFKLKHTHSGLSFFIKAKTWRNTHISLTLNNVGWENLVFLVSVLEFWFGELPYVP